VLRLYVVVTVNEERGGTDRPFPFGKHGGMSPRRPDLNAVGSVPTQLGSKVLGGVHHVGCAGRVTGDGRDPAPGYEVVEVRVFIESSKDIIHDERLYSSTGSFWWRPSPARFRRSKTPSEGVEYINPDESQR
jgi:hypothetical protein